MPQIRGTLMLVVALTILGYLTRVTLAASSFPSASRLQQQGGVALWPWMAGGVDWRPLRFKATPFPVHTVKDGTVPQGQRLVLKPGIDGEALHVGSVQTVISSDAPAEVGVGTAPIHSLQVGKTTYHYDRVISIMTTAYNGSTAMNGSSGAVAAWDGKPLKPGDVAVDPSVIPLGSYLYITGYGPARAVDTGSMVKGDHIDIFFDESSAKIAAYGVQYHKVYVLTGRPHHFSA